MTHRIREDMAIRGLVRRGEGRKGRDKEGVTHLIREDTSIRGAS